MRTFTTRTLLALVGGITLSGCSIQVQSRLTEEGIPADFSSFHFSDWAVAGELVGSSNEEQLFEDVHSAVKQELVARGVHPRPEGEADLLVEILADVELESRQNDPFFMDDTTDLYERGKLTIQVREARSEGLIWEGSASKLLRGVSLEAGWPRVRSVEWDTDRDWDVDRMVGKLMARFP